MTISTRVITIAEYEALPEPTDGTRLELVNGEVIEVTGAAWQHNLIAKHLTRLLDDHVILRSLGLVFTDGAGFILDQDPPTVRVPDVAFVSGDHVPAADHEEGFWPGAPDLAVEIVSANDRATEVRAKVSHYLAAGTRLVWVLWPRDQTVTVYRADGSTTQFGDGDTLDGEDVVPGFTVPVSALFAISRHAGDATR